VVNKIVLALSVSTAALAAATVYLAHELHVERARTQDEVNAPAARIASVATGWRHMLA
jgi:hypothetical protein